MIELAVAHVIAGSAFAVWFALRGAARLDPAAGVSGWGFRCIIVPGAIALWPYLVWRMVRSR